MWTFRDVVDAQARPHPAPPFLSAPETRTTITYGELARNARGVAALLQGEGLARGDVVSFMLGNGAAAATIFLGAMYGGFVVSPVNLLVQDAHLDHVLAHAAPKVVFATAELAPRVAAAVGRIG